jgi:lauroyl/myristoyl acyltransferase
MEWSPTLGAYRAGSVLARRIPGPFLSGLTRGMSVVAKQTSPDRRRIVERNLRRVTGDDLDGRQLDRAVQQTFESYARYWSESFQLPAMSRRELDGRFSYEGFEHIQRARAHGYGPLMVIPHLGGWEWAAFWLSQVAHIPVTAVVEALEPPELFEWFVDHRSSLGMNVVPLGPEAAGVVARAVKQRHVVCLLADRDIGGNGVEVEFFGETTSLPAGPALLALRTGAPLLPCAIYFEGDGNHAVVRPPIPAERQGRLREDIARITQLIAGELEHLIRRAPEQWHLMEPNWPSDIDALAETADPDRS